MNGLMGLFMPPDVSALALVGIDEGESKGGMIVSGCRARPGAAGGAILGR